MSLTTLLNRPDVKKWMRDRFPFKATKTARPLAARPLTDHYTLVGTAFDYIMRWRLERDNPDRVHSDKWIAERGLFIVGMDCMMHGGGDDEQIAWLEPYQDDMLYTNDGLARQVEKYKPVFDKYRELLRRARRLHSRYLKRRVEVGELLEPALSMAVLDYVYRTGGVDALFRFRPDPADTYDLERLHDIMSPDLPDGALYLNPEFGEWSRNVYGADADIICGDTIIDIKTTKFGSFKREYYDQLVGYMLLNALNGGPDIEWLAVYFSRHGDTVRVPAPHVGVDTLSGFRDMIMKYFESMRRTPSSLDWLPLGWSFRV